MDESSASGSACSTSAAKASEIGPRGDDEQLLLAGGEVGFEPGAVLRAALGLGELVELGATRLLAEPFQADPRLLALGLGRAEAAFFALPLLRSASSLSGRRPGRPAGGRPARGRPRRPGDRRDPGRRAPPAPRHPPRTGPRRDRCRGSGSGSSRRSFSFSSSSPILVRKTSACSGAAPASRPMRAIFADHSVCQASSAVSAAWSESWAVSRSVRAAASLVSSLDRFWARSSCRLMASSACSSNSARSEPDVADGFADLAMGSGDRRAMRGEGSVPATRRSDGPPPASRGAGGRPRAGGARRGARPASAPRPRRPADRPARSSPGRGRPGGRRAAGPLAPAPRGGLGAGRAGPATPPCGRRGRPRGAGGRPAHRRDGRSARRPRPVVPPGANSARKRRGSCPSGAPSSQAALTSRQPCSRRLRAASRASSVGTSCCELQGLQLGLELSDRVVFGGQPLGEVARCCRASFLEPGFVQVEGGVQGARPGD